MIGHARLRALLAIFVCTLALAPTSAFGASLAPACGHANTNNPGLHTGLFKNGCLKLPAPAPNPPPAVAGQTVGQGNTSGLFLAMKLSFGGAQVSNPISRGRRAVSLPILSQPQVTAIPWSDRNLWIVTALLPSLIVIFLLIAGRAVADAIQKRGRPVVGPAG